MSFSCRAASIFLCVLLSGSGGIFAQPRSSLSSAPRSPQTSSHGPSIEMEARSLSPIGHSSHPPSSSLRRSPLSLPPPRSSSSFGQALLGSSLGLAVGGPLGVIMIRGAADDSAWETARENNDNCCGLQRIGVGLLGAGAVAGSGPLGAAQRLGRGGVNVYAPSVAFELLFGSFGYGIGWGLGRTDRQKRILSLSVGLPLAAVGAALGAVLANPKGTSSHAALNVNKGRWSVGVPQILLQPHATVDRSPVVHLSLFSAEL